MKVTVTLLYYRRDDLIELIHHVLQYLLILETENASISPVLQALIELAHLMETSQDENLLPQRGRPRIRIPEDQLCFLVDSGFQVKDITNLFLCSKRTIERRLQEMGIRLSDYSSICDSELDELVRSIVSLHPQCGEKTISGQLKSQGYKVQRERIRLSIHRVDPVGVVMRSRSTLHRRVYHVESPNSLWHLDGYHHLIRWNIVIHGGIDRYSRLITYLKVSANNYATSVLTAFTAAVDEFGLPSRIRIDREGENVLVSQYMLQHPERGTDRNSVIAGRSVHNQRIEHLWRDLFSGCIRFFYTFFYFMEDIGVLNHDELVDLAICSSFRFSSSHTTTIGYL